MLHAMWLPEITIRQGHPAPRYFRLYLSHMPLCCSFPTRWRIEYVLSKKGNFLDPSNKLIIYG